MASFFDNWYAQQQQQQPQQGAPQGGGMWTITGPNGETYQVPAEQMGGAGFTPPNQQGMNAGPLPGAIGATAGNATASALLGGPSGAAPAAPEIVGTSSAGISGGPAITASGVPAAPELLGTPAAAAPTWWSSVGAGMTAAAPYAAALYGGYRGIRMGQHLFDTGKGPKEGIKEGLKPANMLAFGLTGSPMLGGLMGLGEQTFGSGKDPSQRARDNVRAQLVETGFLNPDFTLTLPDGNTFDFGKDGNARLPSEGVDPITGKDWRHYYDVDWSKENAGGIVAAVNPLAAAFAGGNDKLTKDFAGYLTNAAMAGGDPMENIMSFIQKAGLDHDKLYGLIHTMAKSQGGKLDDAKADAFKNGLDQLYGVGAYKGKGQQFGTPDIKPGQQPQAQQQQNKPTYTPKPSVQSSPGVTGQPGPVQKPVPKPGGSPFVSSPLNKPRGFYGPPPGMRMR